MGLACTQQSPFLADGQTIKAFWPRNLLVTKLSILYEMRWLIYVRIQEILISWHTWQISNCLISGGSKWAILPIWKKLGLQAFWPRSFCQHIVNLTIGSQHSSCMQLTKFFIRNVLWSHPLADVCAFTWSDHLLCNLHIVTAFIQCTVPVSEVLIWVYSTMIVQS